MRSIFVFILVLILAVLVLATPQRRRDRDRDRSRNRGGLKNKFKSQKKCLVPLVKSCDLANFCTDPDDDTNIYSPWFVAKDKFASGNCPRNGDDLKDVEFTEEDDDEEECGSCPYCDSRVIT